MINYRTVAFQFIQRKSMFTRVIFQFHYCNFNLPNSIATLTQNRKYKILWKIMQFEFISFPISLSTRSHTGDIIFDARLCFQLEPEVRSWWYLIRIILKFLLAFNEYFEDLKRYLVDDELCFPFGKCCLFDGSFLLINWINLRLDWEMKFELFWCKLIVITGMIKVKRHRKNEQV